MDAEAAYLKLLDAFFPPAVNDIYPAMDVITLPKDIVQHYASIGDQDVARQKADWAIGYYQRIIGANTHTPLTVMATRLLAEVYNFKGEYQQSVNLLQTVRDSTGNVVDAAQGMIADLYFTRLDRKDEANRMYQDLVSKAADSMVVASSLLKLATIEFKNKRLRCRQRLSSQVDGSFPTLAATSDRSAANAGPELRRSGGVRSRQTGVSQSH